jgi:hypothetical protein
MLEPICAPQIEPVALSSAAAWRLHRQRSDAVKLLGGRDVYDLVSLDDAGRGQVKIPL